MADETKRLGGSTVRLNQGETAHLRSGTTFRQVSGDTTSLAVGMLFDGRYRIEADLGTGGEATVYRAIDQTRNASVAIKLYRQGITPNEGVLEKLSRLDHPDVLRVLDYGTINNSFFEVTEYAAGGSLEHAKIEEKHLCETVLPEVVNAFRYIHSQEVIHRDIKPANLFHRNPNHTDIVVGDFGLSSSIESGLSEHETSRVGASWEYAAPELYGGTVSGAYTQVFGKSVDYYALGLTLIALFLGRGPFDSVPAGLAFRQKIEGEVPLPEGFSERFQRLLRGLLHPHSKKRWGLDEVERWIRGEDVVVPDYEKARPQFRYKLDEGLVAESIEELGKLLLDHPDQAKLHIGEGIVGREIERFDQALGSRLLTIVKEASSAETAFLRTVYTLCPSLPYRLMDGHDAESPEALALVIDEDETTRKAGKQQLFGNLILVWLNTIGRVAPLKQWEKVSNSYSQPGQQDAGLEYFLHLLRPRLPWPKLKLKPETIDLGRVEGAKSVTRELVISRGGRGYLTGVIESREEIEGLKLSPNLFSGDETKLTLSLDTAPLQRGKTYQSALRISSNSSLERAEFHWPLRFSIVFPYLAVLKSVALFALVGAVFGSLVRYFMIVVNKQLSGWSADILNRPDIMRGEKWVIAGLVFLVCVLVLGFRERKGRSLSLGLITVTFIGSYGPTFLILLAKEQINLGIAAFIERLMMISHALSPIVGWALVGFVIGGSVALWISASRSKAPQLRLYAIGIPILLLGGLSLGTTPWISYHKLTYVEVVDEFNGSTRGKPFGISYRPALNGLGASFSDSRISGIEYPDMIPEEGTLEWWVNIESGFVQYEMNGKMVRQPSEAQLFSMPLQLAEVALRPEGVVFFSSNNPMTDKGCFLSAPTTFRFKSWRSLGISYGRKGRFLMVDGVMAASDTTARWPLLLSALRGYPGQVPTLGTARSIPGRSQLGFQGIIDRFRISPVQLSWVLAAVNLSGVGRPKAVLPGKTPTTAGAAGQQTDNQAKEKAEQKGASAEISLTILSAPESASVLIDRKFVGVTPLVVALPPGSHGVSIYREGYKHFWDIIEVQQGGKVEFSYKLEKEE